MVLHHLHVHQRRPGAVGQRHTVAGADQGIRARLEDAAEAAGAEDDRFRAEQLQPTAADLQGHHTDAGAVLHHQIGEEPFFVDPHLLLHQLLVHHVEHGLAGDVGDEIGTSKGGAAEVAGAQPPRLVAVEDHPHVFQLDDVLWGLAHADFDGVLIAEIVAALHGIVGV